MKKLLVRLLLLAAIVFIFSAHQPVQAKPQPAPQQSVTAQDLLNLVNGLRTANGLPALTINNILMSTAQATAQQMADQNLSWHIGGTSARVKAAGYGGGATVWATENFATHTNATIEWIQQVWADEWHMIPMKNPIYCDLGAGVAAAADGRVYYVVHAAYTSTRYCGEYIGPGGITLPTIQAQTREAGGTPSDNPPDDDMSNWMQPVVKATPNAAGELIHDVLYGHTLWTIAITYDTKIDLIKQMNSIYGDNIYPGQSLRIPTSEFLALSQTPTVAETPQSLAFLTESTQPAATATPTRTATTTPRPQTLLLIAEEAAPTPENQSSTSAMILIVFSITGVVILLSFWQPWKPRVQPEPDDPLTSKVE
jgi:LysM repeat protein